MQTSQEHFITIGYAKFGGQTECIMGNWKIENIAYAILAWGSTYISSLQKVQVKQNHVARLIFFANIHIKDTESALLFLNLLDVLTIYNIYSLHVLKLAHLWHKGQLPDVFHNTFQYASEVHSYNARYATQKNYILFLLK